MDNASVIFNSAPASSEYNYMTVVINIITASRFLIVRMNVPTMKLTPAMRARLYLCPNYLDVTGSSVSHESDNHRSA